MPNDITKDQLIKKAQELQQKLLHIAEEAKELTKRAQNLTTGISTANGNPFNT